MKAAGAAPKKSEAAVFDELRAIFAAHVPPLSALVDKPGNYQVVSPTRIWRGKPLWVGGVRAGKSYTSFHLMGVYGCPELLRGMSPELKRRMQGKSCFNFKAVDPKLFAELKQVAAAGIERFVKLDLEAMVDGSKQGRKKK